MVLSGLGLARRAFFTGARGEAILVVLPAVASLIAVFLSYLYYSRFN